MFFFSFQHLRSDPPGTLAQMAHADLAQTLLARGYYFDPAAKSNAELGVLLRQHLNMTKDWKAQDAAAYWAPLWLYSALSS